VVIVGFWGCTAPIEVAHDIQNGVLDRLSIQYLNSTTMADLEAVGLAVVAGRWVSRTSIEQKGSLSHGPIQMPIFGMAEGAAQPGQAYLPARSQHLQIIR